MLTFTLDDTFIYFNQLKLIQNALFAFSMYYHVSKKFKKLLIKGVPVILVRILCAWCRCQQLCIQWGKTKSSFFTTSNGVRQGGILSPKLFFVYMDDLSSMLIRNGVGCYIDNVCVNHVFYADDLCLMAPCAIALQELLNIYHSYSIIVDLNFNAKKSFCFAFTPRLLSYLYHIYTLTTFLYRMLIQSSI